MNKRSQEVKELISLSPEVIIEKSGEHLIVCETLEALYNKFAEDIAKEIIKNNERGNLSRFILPIGPTGQYPVLCDLIKQNDISLKNCWFFFMDEYCDEDGNSLKETHPLSFKKVAKELFFNKLPRKCEFNGKQVYIPNEKNIGKLEEIINDIGGIDVCYGGIGIHGHVAFNEPEEHVKNSSPRKVRLNNFTITINAIRANVGGNVENFPKEAFTLGMNQILNAKKIRLYCRNGTPYDWANCILRISLLGFPNYDYPVTYIRNHSDYVITTDRDTLKTPENII